MPRMNQPTIRDEIVATVARVTSLPVSEAYRLADEILTGLTKTDRLIDRGEVYRVIETDWLDGNDEHKSYTVYTQPEAEEIR